MATNIRELLKQLPKKRQEAIEARAQVLIKEEMNLQELRKAQQLTQHQLAQKLSVKQAEISRLENREDLLLSSLNSWVEAMGGQLEIIAKIAGQKIRLVPSGSGILMETKVSKSNKPRASAHK